jgi:uncharacterized cupin superfamily protein
LEDGGTHGAPQGGYPSFGSSLHAVKGAGGLTFSSIRQRVGLALGAKKLGYSVYVIPPGKTAFPCHAHYANEEMIYIFEGEGVVRIGKDEVKVSGGTFIAFSPGADSSHQLITSSAEKCVISVSARWSILI